MNKDFKIGTSWGELMSAVELIEALDIRHLAYEWVEYKEEADEQDVTRYNFRNISISIEHGNVESFIRCELDPEIQICYIQGPNKREALREAILQTIAWLNERQQPLNFEQEYEA
jgi:hypothetical protein